MSAKHLALSLFVALMLSACGGDEPAPQSTTPTAAPAVAPTSQPPTVAPTATQPAEQPVAVPTETDSRSAAADEFSGIANIEASLESLDSYRVRFTLSFEGKDEEGRDRQGSLEIIQEFIAESEDQRVHIASVGLEENAVPRDFGFLTIGGVSYLYGAQDGSANCVSFSGGDPLSNPAAMFKPGDVLGGLNKARLVERGVTVNGIKTNHYAVDESGISAGMFSRASGDIWVAQDGDLVVKYTGTATGKLPMFGEDTEGTATWNYQLEAINTLAEIELPEECLAQKPADDIPVPASATDKARFGGLITFKTADKPDEVVEFYQTELPKLGWTEGDAGELGDLRTLSFAKDDRSLSIMIAPGDDGTSVVITEQKGE